MRRLAPLDATATSENPYTLAHWLGVFDTRPLALLRILLGLVLAEDFAARVKDAAAFLTDDGFVARAGSPVTAWSLFDLLHASPALAAALLSLGIVAAIAFALGYQTRLAAVGAWIVSLSVQHRAGLVQTGGDTIAACLLFLSLFTDVSARWSLDAARKGPKSTVHALIPRCMMYLPVVLYLETARAKLGESGSQWLNGPLIYEHLHMHGWVRPVGMLLRDYPMLCALLTTSTIVIELLIPLLFALPILIVPARFVSVVSHVGLQIGILLTLKVGIFTNVMLATTAVWLLPQWFDWAAAHVQSASRWLRSAGPADDSARSPARLVMIGVGFVLFVLATVDPVIPSHLPSGTRPMLMVLGLDLKVGLFTKGSPSERWEATGVLADGSSTDPVMAVAPGTLKDGGFVNTLWMQVPYRITDYSAFGRYVCRKFNAAPGHSPLRSWTLTRRTRPPYPPNVPVPPESSTVVLEQSCG